jgi:hypothetical protein
MLRNFEGLRHDMFARAIRSNVVIEPRWRRRIHNRFFRFATDHELVKPTTLSQGLFEHPELNPLTHRYWESTPNLYAAPAGIIPWVIELARVSIQDAQVGVCKSLEQVVIHPDIQSPQYYSTIASWGNPFVLPDLLTITWYFRLERCDTPEPPVINVSSPTPQVFLPGEPHFDLPQITDLWFPAASPPGQNIHLTIGSRYRLRVVAIVERTQEFAVSISAKIRGFSVGVYSDHTLRSIRSW